MIGNNLKVETAPVVSGNRYHGGANAAVNDHPYVKGYFYVFFGFPSALFDSADAAATSAEASQGVLLTSAEGFTPPGDRTLTSGDIQGQGGVDSSFITGQQITREFSIQYKDYWGAPIFRIHRQWSSVIDPHLGGSKLAKFAPSEYKGVCMVIQTKPIAGGADGGARAWTKDDIIKIDLFDGVVPQTDLKSAYDANVTDNSFVKPSVQYKFDGFPLDETDSKTLTNALAILESAKLFDRTSKAYKSLADSKIGTASSNSVTAGEEATNDNS